MVIRFVKSSETREMKQEREEVRKLRRHKSVIHHVHNSVMLCFQAIKPFGLNRTSS